MKPPPDGSNAHLTVVWTAPVPDSNHSAATSYNLRYETSEAGAWTIVSGVTSPYTITGLPGATSINVEVQGTDAGGNSGEWSATANGKTWGAIIGPGTWTAAASQIHNTEVAPNGGVQMTASAAPTAVAGAAFAWSASQSVIPTTNLISASPDGQTDGWGQYFNAPATSGTYYLWMLAQGSDGVTAGARVSAAITVS